MRLVGHSLGGYLAVAYAERFPERVERIVLLSPVGIPQRQLPRDPQRAVEGGREAPYQAPVGSNREKPLVISNDLKTLACVRRSELLGRTFTKRIAGVGMSRRTSTRDRGIGSSSWP